jgi:septal ring factor EnvC (AmiA/AmiB activator)
MRKKMVLHGIVLSGLLLLGMGAAAQVDSTGTGVTNDKKLIKLLAKVNEDSAKLVKFNGMVSQFEKDKKDAANQAQESADDNKRAADRLADNPQDKKLARRARSAARTAKSDSQKARVAADKLDDLNSDIQKLTRQLGKEQGKLATYQAARAPAISAH